MKKFSILIMVLILVLVGTISTVNAKSDEDIAYDMLKLLKKAQGTMSGYANNKISYEKVVEDFQDYSAEAKFIYIETLKSSKNKEFIKLTAGLTLTMDLYKTGFKELNTDKIETANKVFEYILTPQIDNIR